jgi:hypothetical protein
MKPFALARTLLLAAVVLALAACPGRGDPAAEDAARIDTTNENPLDGLSAEQLERQAEPMTPEQAAELGIVDTTILLEDHTVLEDTLPVPPGTLPDTPTDTLNVPPDRPGTR